MVARYSILHTEYSLKGPEYCVRFGGGGVGVGVGGGGGGGGGYGCRTTRPKTNSAHLKLGPCQLCPRCKTQPMPTRPNLRFNLDHILRFENFNLQRPAEYAKISKCNGTTKQIANFAWIFIFVNEFPVKFAFVFVHCSCRF